MFAALPAALLIMLSHLTNQVFGVVLLLVVARFDVLHNLSKRDFRAAQRNMNVYSNPNDDPAKRRKVFEMRGLSGAGSAASGGGSSRPASASYKPVINPITGYSRY